MSSLDTPEEIEKYRNERKKCVTSFDDESHFEIFFFFLVANIFVVLRNFPTSLNSENKAKFETEKLERGAVLETRQFGFDLQCFIQIK